MMARPRCGVPDVMDPKLVQGGHKRERRYVDSGYRWGRDDLRYRITEYTDDLSRSVIKQEIAHAFKVNNVN